MMPINEAEAVLDPFFEHRLADYDAWNIRGEPDCGFTVEFISLMGIRYQWTSAPTDRPVLRMSRTCDVCVSDFDRLLISTTLPPEALLRVRAETDAGPRSLETRAYEDDRREYAICLKDASELRGLRIEVQTAHSGSDAMTVTWTGLQNSERLSRYLGRRRWFDSRWPDHLRPADCELQFQPQYGLLANCDELAAMRKSHLDSVAQHGESCWTRLAAELGQLDPEPLIREADGFSPRFARDRDLQPIPCGTAPALAGLVLQDADLLRYGARCALSHAMCEHWHESFFSSFPGSAWDHRCFRAAHIAGDVARTLDLAGELFTEAGLLFCLRRLAEEGIGIVNYNTWKYEYIHHMNQLQAFSEGRMCTYGVLMAHWPRVAPYMAIARKEVADTTEETIQPDGSYVEGPSYMAYGVGNAGRALCYYARATGRAVEEVMPDGLDRTAAFAEAICSTDRQQDVVPVCDAGEQLPTPFMAMMAALVPDSRWVQMYQESRGDRAADAADILTIRFADRVSSDAPAPEPFVQLAATGLTASNREVDGQRVKLLLMGNKAGAGHTHEDKGSFVLEFAGETFAMDPGKCNYGNPLMAQLKQCQRHNMLVPYGTGDRPHPQCPLPADIKPQAEGDERSFHALVDLTVGWEEYYKVWKREWDSPRPDLLRIMDRWELARGTGVDSYWNTRLPVRVEGSRVTIEGSSGRVVLSVPAGAEVRVEELRLATPGDVQRRITFRCGRPTGEMVVEARLIPTGRTQATH